MPGEHFQALVVTETADHQFRRNVTERSVSDLPEGEVLIRVRYSSLNYKDALSATGNRGVTKRYPHTPGIDAAGEVARSRHSGLTPGDPVIVTGYDLGMNTAGGFAEYIRVPAAWVVPLPDGLTLRESMIYGTAGFTAGLALFSLQEHGLPPAEGEILVTGATGGVGSLAVALLADQGYRVIAATGKKTQHEYLQSLGAAGVISRQEVTDTSGRPLLSSRWAGAVDTVGGLPLATAIRSTRPYGCVTTCGNAASAELSLTVYPFILRGVTLCGIASAETPMSRRLEIWDRLAGDWKPGSLGMLSREVSLEELDTEIDTILQGHQVGRVVVNLG